MDESAPIRVNGVLVHRFDAHGGPIYRPCSGPNCVYCADLTTARAYLSFWGRSPEHRCPSETPGPSLPRP
ncbi:MAG: hypothetical protein VKK03_02045 [Synechococcus sp.]|nr:hypothetical protein [Synechococcus sp.]